MCNQIIHAQYLILCPIYRPKDQEPIIKPLMRNVTYLCKSCTYEKDCLH
jgi:hypothetical protein